MNKTEMRKNNPQMAQMGAGSKLAPMIERTTRLMTDEEKTQVMKIARGYRSAKDLSWTILRKTLWIVSAGCLCGIILLLGACCVIVASDEWAGIGVRLLGLCLIGASLAALLSIVNAQVKSWKHWQTTKHAAQTTLNLGVATVTTYHFIRQATITDVDDFTLFMNAHVLDLGNAQTLFVQFPDCFLGTDPTTRLELVYAGPFELAINQTGSPLDCQITFDVRDVGSNQKFLLELINIPQDPNLPPGWFIYPEPFDTFISRLKPPPG